MRGFPPWKRTWLRIGDQRHRPSSAKPTNRREEPFPDARRPCSECSRSQRSQPKPSVVRSRKWQCEFSKAAIHIPRSIWTRFCSSKAKEYVVEANNQALINDFAAATSKRHSPAEALPWTGQLSVRRGQRRFWHSDHDLACLGCGRTSCGYRAGACRP